MDPTFKFVPQNPSVMAIGTKIGKLWASVNRPRHLSLSMSHETLIGSNNDLAALGINTQYDDAAHALGQYDDAPYDFHHVGMIAVKRTIARAHIHKTGNNGEAMAPLTTPFAVVTPELTATTPTVAVQQGFNALALPDLDTCTFPSDKNSGRQVLLGSGGHTSHNPGNLAARQFCSARSSKYKVLKFNKDKQLFVKTAYDEFIKNGSTFWMMKKGGKERAEESQALKYFQQKLRGKENARQERKVKRPRSEAIEQQMKANMENVDGCRHPF